MDVVFKIDLDWFKFLNSVNKDYRNSVILPKGASLL